MVDIDSVMSDQASSQKSFNKLIKEKAHYKRGGHWIQ